ncbi:2-oxo acid dehydrogenase subunit E2 [Sphaerisporangium sp. B11E5]|uniref:2-oxo acid dehydrogenase subunit E2 n=1 Tax=Sphaerisporangium sp. B11E5 TaxID=3153563 RepID=UPI00325F6A52
MTDVTVTGVTDVRVPKLNNNDQSYTLTEWLVGDDEPIGPDEIVATIETSKSVQDLVCAEGGVLRHLVPAGSECAPGDVVARVVPPGTPRSAAPAPAAAPAVDDKPVITAPARALMEELGVDPELVRTLGVRVVRRSDVEALAETVARPRTATLPRVQQAVARTVTVSHRTIPAAYTAIRVDVGAATAAALAEGRRLRKIISLPELLVAAVATLHEQFPLCFAEPLDDRTARLSDAPHIGVTIDVGTGLFVPVVRDAARLTLAQIADTMLGFRQTALTGAFREEELTGGTIGVTLHNDPDVVLAVPLVFPGQTCALALSGAREELTRDTAGEVVAATVCHIGLAYDHRFVNGRDATLFLQALKEALTKPERLIAP